MFQKNQSHFVLGAFLVLLVSAQLVTAGHIYSWDVQLEHQNAGEARFITLFFSLESGLPIGNQILVEFPKEIITGDSCLLGPVGTTITGGCSVSSNTKSATVLTTVALNANDWYQLRIQLTNQGGQTEGYQGVIAFSTQSSGANKIIYDSNSAFAQYQLAVKPDSTLDVTQTNPSGVTDKSKTALGASNEYYLDVTPKVKVVGGSKWAIELDGNDFLFVSTCNSQALTCLPTDSGCVAILAQAGACTVDPTGKRIIFLSDDDIVVDKKFRIKATVKNPTYKANSIGYTVSSESKISKLFFEKRAFSNKLSVSELSILAPFSLKFLWGAATFDGSSLSRCKIGFYKSGANINVFNNFILTFSVPLTPDGQNLKVSFSIPSVGFAVLTSSISTTLPSFPSKDLIIKVTGSSIEIWNVGQLTDTSSTSYVLRGRCIFTSSASNGDFGAVKVEAIMTGDAAPIQIGLSTGVSFNLITNYEYAGGSKTLDATDYHHSTNVAKYGYIFVSSKLTATTFDNTDASVITGVGTIGNTLRPGIPLSTTDKVRALLFTINPGPEHICCKGNSCEANTDETNCGLGAPYVILLGMVANSDILALSTTPGQGLQILEGFWGSVLACSNPLAYTQYGCTPSTNGDRENRWTLDSANKAGHLRLHYVGVNPTIITRSTGTNPAGLVLKEATSNGGIYNSAKEQTSQLYGGQQVVDFIICFNFVAGAVATDSGLATASQSLINTFIIENGAESNLKIRLVNYIDKSDSSYNYAVPVFLRVYGKLSGSSSGTILSIFLDNFLDIKTFTQGNCLSSVSGVTCVTYPESTYISRGNPNFKQRIDLRGANPQASTTNFDHIIPVKTRKSGTDYIIGGAGAADQTFFFDIGILGADGSDSRFSMVKSITRITGYAWGGSKLYSGLTNGLVVKNDITVGTSSGGKTQYDSADCGLISTSSLPVSDSNFDPGYIFTTGISISFTTTTTTVGCLGSKDAADVLNTGVLFAHTSLDLIGNAEIKWNNADNLICKKYSFASAVDSTKKSIGFLCILSETLTGSNVLASADSKVTLSGFTVPWRWGNQLTKNELGVHQSWSRTGENAAYHSHPAFPDSGNNFASSCTSSDWSSISRNTKNQQIKFTFTPSTGVELTIASNEKLEVRAIGSGLTIAGWSEISCKADLSSQTDVLCQASSQTFAIQGRSSGITKSLAKLPQTIYYRGNQDSTVVVDKSVYLEIWFRSSLNNAVKIDVCDFAQPKKIPSATTEDVAILSMGDPVYSLTKGARSSFYFTFGVSGTTRLLWKDTVFDFTLGWLGDKLGDVNNNLHCFARSGNSLSFIFSELDMSTPTNPKLTVGSDNALGSFTFQCNGAASPSLVSTADMKFSWKDSLNLLGEVAPEAYKKAPNSANLNDGKSDTLVTLESKLWNSPGFEATYVFNFTPKYDNYTVSGRIYIDFSIDLPPRGNRAANPFCTIDGASANCDFIEERRLSVWLLKDLAWKPSLPYQLIVYRIAQPTIFASSFKKITLTLDKDNNPYNGVSEWGSIDDINPSSTPPTSIGIMAYSTTNSFTRSISDISISMNLPADSVTKDAVFYVQLPNYWDDVLSFTPNVNCGLYRESDLLITNLVLNCSVLPDRKLRFYTNLDSNSSMKNIYILKLNSFPTPYNPTPSVPAWINVFQASADQRTVTKTTVAGFINATVVTFAQNPNQQNPVWFTRSPNGRNMLGTGNLDVYLGTYRTDVYLGYANEKDVANVTYDFSFTGNASSYVLVSPVKPRVVFGYAEQKLTIAGKTGIAPGRYILTVSKTGDQSKLNSEIPALPIVLRPDQCQINPSFTVAKIPSGGLSLPIVFDFAPCMPITDVEITGEFTSSDKYNISFTKDNNAALISTQKLVFSSFSDTRLSFVLYSNNASQEVGKATNIEWRVGGTEKASYGVPLVTRVEYIDSAPFKTSPSVTSFTATPAAGKVTLSITCSSTGSYFWAIGLGGVVNDLTLNQIQAKTVNVKRAYVPRDSTDLNWVVYGYGDQAENKANTFDVTGVRAGGNYNATAYCTNQLFAASTKANVANGWNQTDNGARISRVGLNFTSVLTENQQIDIACAFAKLLSIPASQVRTQSGSSCPNIRLLQTNSSTSNSSNSSNSSNTTTDNNTNPNPTPSGYSVYFWFILPDYSIPQSTTHIAAKELYDRGVFVDQLLSRTNNGASSFGQVAKAGLDISQSLNPVVGKLGAPSNPKIGLSWVEFSISIVDRSGFVIAGVGFNSTTQPSARQLRDGLDANNSNLVTYRRQYYTDRSLSFNFTGLQNNTNYKIFYMSSTDDPGQDAFYGDVNMMNVRTLNPGSFADKIWVASLTIIALIVLAVI